MTTRVFIDGGAGTTGLEIRERLANRAGLALITLPAERRKDAAARAEALNEADVVILCLPDDAAREAVSLIANPRTRVIDASTAYRTDPAWTYGFPELEPDGHARVAGALRISNPGCYPTGFLALVRPLVREGLLSADTLLCVNAVSGYSGGGKALIARFEDPSLPDHIDSGLRAYGLDMAHKHVPEMRVRAGLAHAPAFLPSVARSYRGMLVEVPLHLTMVRGKADDVRATLAQAYADSALVHVSDERPAELFIERCAKSDRLELFVLGGEQSGHLRLIAALDNLGKGAAGAAVQSLNLMAGLPETDGLRL